MKRISKLLIMVVWGGLIYLLFKLNLLTGNLDNLNEFFDSCGAYKVPLFIVLSSLRVAAMIPSAVFMVLGGLIFNPFHGFLFTLASIVLSESIVYITSKALLGSSLQSCLIKKHPKLYEMLLRNNTKILAIGILCPVAPSDVACFLAGSTGLSYRKFIASVVVSNLPMMILYAFLGNSILSSGSSTIMLIGVIVIISIYSLHLWKKEQRVHSMA